MGSFEEGRNNAASFRALNEIEDRTNRGIRQAFFRTGRDLTDELSRQMLEKNKRGFIYIVAGPSGRRRKHRASAKRQTAANLTGTMRKARGFQLKGVDQLEFGIRSGKGAEYSAFLEKTLQRPSLGNSVEAQQKNTQNNFETSIQNEFSGG